MMSEIFLFSSFVLNAASAIPANNLELRPNVIPFELEVIIDLEAVYLCNLIMLLNVTSTSIKLYQTQAQMYLMYELFLT